MRIDILTLFPASVDAMMNVSILGRAQERGYITIKTHQIRDYTTNKQMQVDDYPYGGGRGAVMQADPLYRCWAHVCEEAGSRGHTIYLSPCGRTFTQSVARELKDKYDHLILVCGHYEGIDQRFIDECVDEELSMGDFVVTGGEIPAMAVTDAICRMVPGVLPEEECFTEESHWAGLLEYPTNGTDAACRTCCSPATTKTWPNGAKKRAISAQCSAALISGRSSTKSSSKQRARKKSSPKPRPKQKPSAPRRWRRLRRRRMPQNRRSNKKPRRVSCCAQHEIKSNSFSAATCAWQKTLCAK